MDSLSSLKNKEFEKAYIDAMVKGHTEVLGLFDNNFIKNASDAALKKQLLATRPHIESHLKQAQELQKNI